MKKYVVVGGGISGMFAAYLLKKKDIDSDVLLIEKTDSCGGLSKSFQYSGLKGVFDQGIHTIYDTGISKLDEMVRSFLPSDEWIELSGRKRDYGGAYLNGVLQENSPYIDIRNFQKGAGIQEYRQSFLDNLHPIQVEQYTNVEDILYEKYGSLITNDIIKPVINKLYPLELSEIHPLASALLPLERIVLFDKEKMNEYNDFPLYRESLAYPEQLKMPLKFVPKKSVWYPKKYGMYRFVDAMLSKLKNMGVVIKVGSEISSFGLSNCGRVHLSIKDVTTREESVENIDKVYWSSSIPSAYFSIFKKEERKSFDFDPPVKTMFVHFGLNSVPNVKGLFYIYCMEHGFITHRLSCPSSFCPDSYKDGVYRLSSEVILNNEEMTNDDVKERVIQELIEMGVFTKNNILFSVIENISGGYPTPSTKNVNAIFEMKSAIVEKYKGSLDFLGTLSEPNLFFQYDILQAIYKKIN